MIIKNWNKAHGFTLIEFLLVMAIFGVLVGLTTVNLFSFQHKSQLSATTNTFIADLKEQQTKAMTGDTEGQVSTNETYGINFDTTRYVLFRGIYSSTAPSNFAVNLPNTIQVTTTFPNSQVVFERGSGEVYGYSSSTSTITLRDIVDNKQTTIQLNRYGIITSVN